MMGQGLESAIVCQVCKGAMACVVERHRITFQESTSGHGVVHVANRATEPQRGL